MISDYYVEKVQGRCKVRRISSHWVDWEWLVIALMALLAWDTGESVMRWGWLAVVLVCLIILAIGMFELREVRKLEKELNRDQ